jgi:hypothetical protein
MMILAIPFMGLMAGWSGGSIRFSKMWDKIHLTWAPEVFFAAPIALALYPLVGLWALVALPWAYLWMQTGHANALYWGINADPARTNTLTPVVDSLAKLFGIKIFGRGYSALFFAVKGFLISLPVGGVGIVLWPLAYDIGVYSNRKLGLKGSISHALSEVLSGAFLGLWVYIFTLLIN